VLEKHGQLKDKRITNAGRFTWTINTVIFIERTAEINYIIQYNIKGKRSHEDKAQIVSKKMRTLSFRTAAMFCCKIYTHQHLMRPAEKTRDRTWISAINVHKPKLQKLSQRVQNREYNSDYWLDAQEVRSAMQSVTTARPAKKETFPLNWIFVDLLIFRSISIAAVENQFDTSENEWIHQASSTETKQNMSKKEEQRNQNFAKWTCRRIKNNRKLWKSNEKNDETHRRKDFWNVSRKTKGNLKKLASETSIKR